jgi:type VI secretion system FHA domain protein
MRLRLSVTSEERAALGHRARHEFDANGGVIGRNAACAWSLPDPTNTVSARHATISHNGRGFLITDTSTNGVYLNTVDAPIGRGAAAVLTHGDTLYLGHFVISVEVVDEPDDARRRVGAAATATPMIGGGETAWPAIGAQPRPATPPPFRPPTTYPSAPPMGSPSNGAGGLSDLLSPNPGVGRPASRPLAPPSISPATIPPGDFAPPRPAPPSLERAAAPPMPPSAPPRVEARSEGAVIPTDAFPVIAGASAQVATPNVSNLAPPARPSAAAPVAKAPLIPDVFDFSDLMGPKTGSPPTPSGGARPPPAPLPLDFSGLAPAAAAPIAPPAAPSPGAKPPPMLPLDFSDLSPAASAPIAPPAAPSPGAKLPPAIIPVDFSDLSPAGAPIAPLAAPSPAAKPPPATLPLDLSDPSPAANAPTPAAPPPRTSLRAAASLAPDAAPVLLDPVAVLRQRADDYSNAARQAPPEPPPLPPRPQPPASITPAEPPRLSTAASPVAARAAIPLAQPPGEAPATGSHNAAIAALCEGLGLNPAEIPPHVLAQTLLEFGRALRVAVDGMMPVLAARRSLKGELHMDQTRLQPRENNPLKFLSSGGEVLRAALKPDASGFLSLSEAMREGFSDIRAHEVAAIVALQGVVKAVLERFDPAALEGSGGGGKLFGRGPDKGKLWDQFLARYAAIADDPDRTIRDIVGGEFARAYAQQTQAETQGRP